MKTFLLLLFFALQAAWGGYVNDLTDATFKDAVARSKNMMVAFYSPRCGYSQMLLFQYKKVAEELANVPSVTIAKVNCLGAGMKTCWSIPVRGYPTVIFYKDGKRLETYNDGRTKRRLLKFIREKADIPLKKSAPPQCGDHWRCVSYAPYKDTMCYDDAWMKENCRKTCGSCTAGLAAAGAPAQAKKPAKVAASWGSWSGYTSCSATCGAGTQQKVRVCNGDKKYNYLCQGPAAQTRKCKLKDCDNPCAPCKCSGERMSCSRRGLTAVPTNIPTDIKHLDLQSNRISIFNGDEFSALKNLESIKLGRNGIETLPNDVFQALPKLKSINLYGNKLSALPRGLFAGLFALERLMVSNNGLESIDTGAFDEVVNLKYLSLQNNKITKVASGVFDNTFYLTRLQLYGNQLQTLPPTLFHKLPSLTNLQLHSNKLTNLPANMFQGLASLTRLSLGRNRITSIPVGLFQGLVKVTWLSLKNNMISTLPQGVFSSLDPKALRTLNLWGNPLKCSCELFDTLGDVRRRTWGKCDGNVRITSLKRDQVCPTV